MWSAWNFSLYYQCFRKQRVMRIECMIREDECNWYFNEFSPLRLLKKYRNSKWESQFWYKINKQVNNDLEVAHPQSGSSSTWFLGELEFGNVGFWGEGKTGVPLGAKERTNNKLNPHMASTPGFEPGPYWWEASALTTAQSLAPRV